MHRIGLAAAGALLLTALAATEAAAQNGNAARTVRDGVFSAAQARRGESVFSNVCIMCHTRGQFVGAGGYQENWQNRTFFDVFDQLRNTMPNDNPGGLPRRDYIDVIIYLLSENGYPAGEKDLAGTDEALKSIRIVPPESTPAPRPRPQSRRPGR